MPCLVQGSEHLSLPSFLLCLTHGIKKKNSLLSLHYRETREREKARGQRTITMQEHERRKWGRAHEKQLFFLSLPRALHWGHPWQILSSRISNQKNRCGTLAEHCDRLGPEPKTRVQAQCRADFPRAGIRLIGICKLCPVKIRICHHVSHFQAPLKNQKAAIHHLPGMGKVPKPGHPVTKTLPLASR